MRFRCVFFPFLRMFAALLIATALAGAASPARAQLPPGDETVSVEELERFIATLEDEAERKKFVDQLRAAIAAKKEVQPDEPALPDRVATRFLKSISESLVDVGKAVFDAVDFVTDAPKFYDWFARQLSDEDRRARLADIFGKLALALGAGWAAEWVAAYGLRRARNRLERSIPLDRATVTLWRLGRLLVYVLICLVPIVVFGTVALAALTFSEPSRTARLVTLAFVNANVMARLVGLVSIALVAPRAAGLRLTPMADETAAYVDLWVRRLANFSIYGFVAIEAGLLLGLPDAGHDFLSQLLGLLIGLLLLALILQSRHDVARALAGRTGAADDGEPNLRARIAKYWHVGAVSYVVFVTMVWLIQPDGGFAYVARATVLTIVIAATALALATIVRRLLRHLLAVSEEARRRYPGLEARANRYLSLFTTTATAAIYIFAALAVFQAWGLDSLEWLATPFGRRVGGSALAIAAAALAAVGLWELANIGIERYIGRSFGRGMDEWRRAARIRTIQPMVERVVLFVLVAFVGLVVLSELGVNITPLLAVSGAVGIAIGLGAQDLIKDVLAGVSVIAEDSIAIGDVVRLGDNSGVVEWMSVRTIRLRAFDGTVHTIPFSEFKTISNMTKDFAFAVFDVGVAYDADVDKVMTVLKAEGAKLREDSDIGRMILEDLEVLGVDKFADSAVVIKARIKTRPIQQWNVMRAFNRRIKIAFDREGIVIPFPQRTLHFANAGPLVPSSPPPA
ncbi:MAG TPA: mechanosensitive ion channel domain-containing protein [Alphaproteobacteria bacterium]|nr:mechanosensitive ion channel domain-containing protein [Alphaproteobacteria bacterium]